MVLLSIACGEPQEKESGVRHLFANSSHENEKTSAIFAARQANGQYCFYGGEFRQNELRSRNWDNKDVVQRLAQGSELLTTYSLHRDDVEDAMLLDTKVVNIISHLLFNPVSSPLSLTCYVSAGVFMLSNLVTAITAGPAGMALTMATWGKVAAVSCGAKISLWGGVMLFGLGSMFTDSFNSYSLVSSFSHDTTKDNIARLHKAFNWLVSRDATQCPAKLKLPVTENKNEQNDKDEQTNKEGA